MQVIKHVSQALQAVDLKISGKTIETAGTFHMLSCQKLSPERERKTSKGAPRIRISTRAGKTSMHAMCSRHHRQFSLICIATLIRWRPLLLHILSWITGRSLWSPVISLMTSLFPPDCWQTLPRDSFHSRFMASPRSPPNQKILTFAAAS